MSNRLGRWVAVVVVAALAVAGCGDDDDTGGGGDRTFEELTLELSGGLEGAQEGVRIASDGAISTTASLDDDPYEPTGGSLDDAALEELRTLVTSDEFAELEEDYRAAGECCDQFDYVVTASVDGEEITSTYSDFTEDVPEVLLSVVGLLLPFRPGP